MMSVVPIVEGDGEVAAVPVLLRRLSQWLTADQFIEIAYPIRTQRSKFLNRDEEFRRMVLLASAKCGAQGWVLILIDADDDCPRELAASIASKAKALVPGRAVSVVCANREFEAWFLASAGTLDGKRGLRIVEGDTPVNPEAIRGAKEWLSDRIADGRYRETTDQPALCAHIDLETVRARSRSFRKLCDDWIRFSSRQAD